jgi:hypothetical protein
MVTLGLIFAGCAACDAATPAGYLGLGKYREYTCSQLEQEARRISSQVPAPHGQKDFRPLSGVIKGSKTIVMWPDAIGGVSKESSTLKEKMREVEEASIQSQCSIEFRRPPHN